MQEDDEGVPHCAFAGMGGHERNMREGKERSNASDSKSNHGQKEDEEKKKKREGKK